MKKKQRQKITMGDRRYSERVRPKWFCCAFKLAFLQLLCKASLFFRPISSYLYQLSFNLIQDGFLQGCSGIMGAKKDPVLKICHTYPPMMNLGSYTWPKEDQKNIWTRYAPLQFWWHQHFSLEITIFCYIRKYRYILHFDTWFIILLTFVENLRIFLINMVTVLMMSAKMSTPGLLKINFSWNTGYEVIISVHEVTNKILSRDSNYIVDVVMWAKFGNSSTSMKEVIITSILKELDQKKSFFERWPWF